MGRRYKRRKKLQMTMFECILLLIVGLLMGTVFTVGMGYWNAAVDPEEAIAVTAQYDGYELHYGHGQRSANRNKINHVDLLFTDHEQLTIVVSCITTELLDDIYSLQKGDTLDMLVHPNRGDTLLSITADGETILAFEDAMKRLTFERWGFFGIGVFCYIGAGVGAYYLIKRKYY